MLVAGVAFPEVGLYTVEFRAQPSMAKSDIVVRRSGNTITILEEDGGPSLGVAETTYCRSANASAPSSEVTCTFPTAREGVTWLAKGDFSAAPRGASLVVEEGSKIMANFTGSPFDDYFQGGDLADSADGGLGNDNLYGGGEGDVLRGGPGDDDIDGELGNDYVYGGPGADTIVGGKGSDTIVGGTGADDIDAKDGMRDVVDCGDPDSRTGTSPEAGDLLEYDEKLDVPTACNVAEWPRVIVPPSVSTLSVKVGETITGTMGQWAGTAPITYEYSFDRCSMQQFVVWPPSCTSVKKGKLDARGLDGGKAPSYTATRSDVDSFLMFSVTARNLPKIGAATTASASTSKVGPPASVTIMGNWLPRQVKGSWVFGNWVALQEAILKSSIGQYADITATPVRRSSVPSAWRKVVTHDSVVELKVNGKAVPVDGKVVVEASPDEHATIAIKYYSWWEDRKTCPVTDEDLATINTSLASSGMPLWLLTRLLDGYAEGCSWVVDWSDVESQQNVFMATGISLEETNDPDAPVRLRITATKPSLRARLAVAVGAPPQAYVTQRPEDFSIAANGRLYDFPGAVYTSVWVGLIGDQVRESGKRGVIELYVNGVRKSSQTFQSMSGLDAPFSTILTTASLDPGTARIVVTTLDSAGGVESQVFVDFVVGDGTKADAGDLITWDGRCFTTSGRPGSCPYAYNATLGAMKNTVNSAIGGALNTITSDYAALRYASEKLDKRFVAVGANGPVSPLGGARSVRVGNCWWFDLFCHIGSLIQGRAQAVTRPKASQAKPPAQRAYRKVVVLPVNSSSVAGGVIGEGILKVPGAGLINLDGGTLINLDGGTLINLDGGTLNAFTRELSALINLDGGTVVGTNGATVVGLNGATLVGVDPASVVGTNGGTLRVDASGALIGLDGGTFSPLTLLTSR